MMRTYRIDYFHGAFDAVYAKREYMRFTSTEDAMAHASGQGYELYEIMPVAYTEED